MQIYLICDSLQSVQIIFKTQSLLKMHTSDSERIICAKSQRKSKEEDKQMENKKDNRAIICSLKQQMTNIRRGMSKLIKIKSQENLNLMQGRYMSPMNTFATQSKKENNYQQKTNKNTKVLEERIKFLQQHNSKLQKKIFELQMKSRRQTSKFQNIQSLLEEQNINLNMKINTMMSELQYLRDYKRSKSINRKQDKSIVEFNRFPVIQVLNPQIQNRSNIPLKLSKQQINTNTLNQEIERLKKIIAKQDNRIIQLEKIQSQKSHLIEKLNQKCIKNELGKLCTKYSRTHI